MIKTKPLIKKLLPFQPQKIILFGSYARGTAKSESDIDLLIIKKTKKKPGERIAEVLKFVWGSKPHIEPQVLTPSEFSRAVSENRFFITEEVLKHGQIIYEKKG
jgi:predicted nucleotidyltransferase